MLGKDNNIETVLFDLDGVLCDLCEAHYLSLNKALKQLVGYEISREDHNSIYNGLSTRSKLKLLVDKGVFDAEKIEDIWLLKQRLTSQAIYDVLRVDYVKIRLLQWLKDNGCKTGCVTNAIKQTAIEALRVTGQIDYIDTIVSNEDCLRNKPDPDQYLYAMRLLNTSCDQTIAIEDSMCGKKAAYASGCFVWEVKGPEDVHLDGFIEFLRKLNNSD